MYRSKARITSPIMIFSFMFLQYIILARSFEPLWNCWALDFIDSVFDSKFYFIWIEFTSKTTVLATTFFKLSSIITWTSLTFCWARATWSMSAKFSYFPLSFWKGFFKEFPSFPSSSEEVLLIVESSASTSFELEKD